MTDKKVEIGSKVPEAVLKLQSVWFSENKNYGSVDYGRAGRDYFKLENGIYIYISEENFDNRQ